MNADPLERLLVDADVNKRERIAAALGSLVGIDASSGRVVPAPGFGALTMRRKIAAYLLGRHASFLLGKLPAAECSIEDIAHDTGLSTEMIGSTLRDLQHHGCVSLDGQTAHCGSATQIMSCLEVVETRSPP